MLLLPLLALLLVQSAAANEWRPALRGGGVADGVRWCDVEDAPAIEACRLEDADCDVIMRVNSSLCLQLVSSSSFAALRLISIRLSDWPALAMRHL